VGNKLLCLRCIYGSTAHHIYFNRGVQFRRFVELLRLCLIAKQLTCHNDIISQYFHFYHVYLLTWGGALRIYKYSSYTYISYFFISFFTRTLLHNMSVLLIRCMSIIGISSYQQLRLYFSCKYSYTVKSTDPTIWNQFLILMLNHSHFVIGIAGHLEH
jgi:hypothetical protein